MTPTPTRIGTDNDWKKLYVHRYHGNASAIAEKQGGRLWGWGSNSSGKLGLGDEAARQEPVPLALQGTWNDFSIGRYYAIAIAADGSLWHSGNYLKWVNVKSGEPTRSNRFERMKLEGKWTGVRMLQQSGVVLIDAEGNIFTYGINTRGQLGRGTKDGSWIPQKVILPVPVTGLNTPQKNATGESWPVIPANRTGADDKLNIVAVRLFANVNSQLTTIEKNTVADLSGFVISKSDAARFTVKGQPPAEEFPFDVFVYPVDLNNDGKEEIAFTWGNSFWSGGAGSSTMIMGKSSSGRYVKIYQSQGFVYLMASKTLGYPDIYQDGTSPNNKYPVYKWNGKEYKFAQTVTGSEALFKTLKGVDDVSKKYQARL